MTDPITEPVTPLDVPPARSVSAFTSRRFSFSPGVHAGDIASIRDENGNVRLTYRSFAGIVSIVAALVAAIVLTAGAAATIFLAADERPGAAIAAAILSVAFAVIIASLVPATRVTLYESSKPVLTITQLSRFTFPFATYSVTTADGKVLGSLRTAFFSRFGRNRWRIAGPEEYVVAHAIEESLRRAMARKFAGKFNRKYQSNLIIRQNGSDAGQIVRRPDPAGNYDFVEITPGTPVDARVAVALATLVFGAEP